MLDIVMPMSHLYYEFHKLDIVMPMSHLHYQFHKLDIVMPLEEQGARERESPGGQLGGAEIFLGPGLGQHRPPSAQLGVHRLNGNAGGRASGL